MALTWNMYKLTGTPSSKAEKTFHTYHNYLTCFAAHISSLYSKPVEQSALYASMKVDCAKFTIDEKILRRFLYIAWNTEYLSYLNDSKATDILRINNQWKPVQIYYAVYSAAEAAAYLIDGTTVEAHRPCINKINRLFVTSLKHTPWCLAYTGSQRSGLSQHNFPAGTKPVNNLLKDSSNHIGIIATCIQAEHKNRIDEFEPRKLSPAQKARREKKKLKIDHDPGYTTLLDLMYRLRIKSNYKDAEIFTVDGPDTNTKQFSKHLSMVGYYTMMYLEFYIMKRWGKEKLIKLMEGYLTSSAMSDGLLKYRIELYKTL